jgi:hypothetical protein
VWLDVMPGGGAGGAAAGPVPVVWARTGHEMSAVAASMVPIEAYLAMIEYLLWTGTGTVFSLWGCARFDHKRTCACDWVTDTATPSQVFLWRRQWRSDRSGADICGSLW